MYVKMKNLNYLFLLFLLFSSIDCYTIVERSIFPEGEIYPYKNNEIIGFWIYRLDQSGVREQIKKLEFFEDGKVTYYPNAEILEDPYMSGKFIIKNDTLIIRLFNNSASEKFLFEVDGSILYLNKIESNLKTRFEIQGRGEVSWEKVIF